MSISSITTLAVARNLRKPTKSDVGVVTAESNTAKEDPSSTDLLAKTVPVGLVSAYTAFIAVVTQVVAAPTPAHPNPTQYLLMRWLAFAILVLSSAVLTLISYRGKAEKNARPPTLEVGAVTVAAAAWGLAIPESPILVAIADKQAGLLALAFIAFCGVAVNLALSNLLKTQSTP